MAPNPAAGRTAPIAAIGYLTSAVFALTAAVMLSGCLPIWGTTSAPLPDIEPLVPPEDRPGARPALLFTQSSSKAKTTLLLMPIGDDAPPPLSTVEAKFLKGKDLSVFHHGRNLYSDWDLVFLTGGGSLAGAIVLPLGEFGSSEEIEKLCLVTPSGRVLTFTPYAKQMSAKDVRREPLHANRREAILVALRSRGEHPFDKTDGPCGIRGNLALPGETLDEVIAYLARLPQIRLGSASLRLAGILARAKRNALEAGPGSAMIFAVVRWRDEELSEPPMYLSAADTRAFLGLARPLMAGEIVSLLPLYSQGTRALESITIEHLCVVQSDGSAWWWSKEENAFELLGVRPQSLEWRNEVIAALKGGQDEQECAPSRPKGWSEVELRGAISFVENLPPVVPTYGMSAFTLTDDAATAQALVLIIGSSHKEIDVFPVYVSGDQDSPAAFLKRLLSLQPQVIQMTMERLIFLMQFSIFYIFFLEKKFLLPVINAALI